MTTSFDELGLSSKLVEVLHENGIEQAFPIQAMTIPEALAGLDVCGMA
jgi:superfamily II DNA/RNA helicase